MSSCVFLADQSAFWVSNKRLSTLLEFGIQVASEGVLAADEPKWLEKLRQFNDTSWPGIDLDLDGRFPSIEEKKFWARIYSNVARRIFLRQLGNHEMTFWQSSAIGDAYLISRILTHAVQQVEAGWHSDSEDVEEGNDFSRQIKFHV